MSKDLYIRRVYTHKGISVAVDIDLVKKEISLVEKNGDNGFRDKTWNFSHRSLEYMQAWLSILDAMKFAITEASKELEAANERDEQAFIELLIALGDGLDGKKK